MTKRILVVSEALSLRDSGGRAALAVAEGLASLGATVKVATFALREGWDEKIAEHLDVSFLSSGSIRRERLRHLFPPASVSEYKNLLAQFRPDVVHFASFSYSKSSFLISAAKRARALVVLQPWIHDAMCAQGYGYREGAPCAACFRGDFNESIRLGCAKGASGYLNSFSRGVLRRTALRNTSWFLSTCADMDERLVMYGVHPERVQRLPLPFHPTHLKPSTDNESEEFAFIGQIKPFKGIHLMPQLLALCPEVKFTLYPFGSEVNRLNDFGITQARFGNLRVVNDLTWAKGLAEKVASSRGLLITTLWPSTTEYALVEGLSMGKAVTAFDVGAHRDYLVDGVNAMVAPLNDSNGFANRIRKLNADATLRAAIGQAGRKLYEQLWEPSRWLRFLAGAYNAMDVAFD